MPAAETESAGEAAQLIARHWAAQGTAFFAAKMAVTLDGRSATRSGHSQWITGEEARAEVMRWRSGFPAIAVGAGTVLADNPRLTVRIPREPDRSANRFIFDGRLRTVAGPVMPHVYADKFRARTIVATTQHGSREARRRLQDQGVQIWTFETADACVPLPDFRRRCTEEGIHGVYVEGGADLLGQFLRERLLDYLLVYTAPMLLADVEAKPAFQGLRTEKITDAIRLANVQHETFGDDRLTRGHVVYPKN